MENRIGELRREKGYTLKELGEILNIRDNTLSQYETGKRAPQLGFLIELAHFFDVSLEYLLKQTDIRDYPINTAEQKITFLQKFKSNDISFDTLSMDTVLDLCSWINANLEFIEKEHNDLYDVSLDFIKQGQSEAKALINYSFKRIKQNKIINAILDELENEDYYGATPEMIKDFMDQSKRISYEDLKRTLEFMKKLPDSKED